MFIMPEKRTSLLIDVELWDRAGELSEKNRWPIKAIMAAALLRLLELDDDDQWKAYRQLAEFEGGNKMGRVVKNAKKRAARNHPVQK